MAFVLGERVKGGQYSEFPSMKSEDLEQGDVVPNHDFRGLYSTILEDWMGWTPSLSSAGRLQSSRTSSRGEHGMGDASAPIPHSTSYPSIEG